MKGLEFKAIKKETLILDSKNNMARKAIQSLLDSLTRVPSLERMKRMRRTASPLASIEPHTSPLSSVRFLQLGSMLSTGREEKIA